MKNIYDIEKLRDFDNHKLIVVLKDKSCDLDGFITIHRGGEKYPSFGATRVWFYESEQEALIDSLRLSRTMSYKSALAGLNYGGAKATIIRRKKFIRSDIFRCYSHRINCLGGKFVTGADVGVNGRDLKIMAQECKYIVGLKSDPVRFTALGVIVGIKASLKEIYGKDDISGRNFAIQGVGKTGIGILKLIYQKAGKIYISDANKNKLKIVKDRFPKVKIVELDEIYKQNVDVLSPCALSNSINGKIYKYLKCKIIAGSANNQLENETIGGNLYHNGILYAPDYVINSGGLIAVVDEYENSVFEKERLNKKIIKIKNKLETIFQKSKRSGKPTNLVANQMAEAIFNQYA